MDTELFQRLIGLLPFVIPILIIQIGMAVYSLFDLSRRSYFHGPRWLWIALLIVSAFAVPSGILVSGLYLAWGRNIEADQEV